MKIPDTFGGIFRDKPQNPILFLEILPRFLQAFDLFFQSQPQVEADTCKSQEGNGEKYIEYLQVAAGLRVKPALMKSCLFFSSEPGTFIIISISEGKTIAPSKK